MKRFVQNTPMYGGTRQARSTTRSVPKLLKRQGDRPFNLASWSLPWPWPTRVTIGLNRAGANRQLVLIDIVRGEGPSDQRRIHAAGNRYGRFAERRLNVQITSVWRRASRRRRSGQVVLDTVNGAARIARAE
jgi:thioesterase domain-containing protein